ncbi:SEC-C domain-containing protein [Martelella lutilitoris]|uniref:SEC-C domain-containing protein n=1 Tax=Martelella lutilitoris TaxID=2583532 RepID=A0A7T7KN11_9HYPH|nr:SEC-C metal-binding domain-containing protein [Martelella lutilitoris]QQM32357.1 SEC-C domain-containing protein [Martelella lutilitoris]
MAANNLDKSIVSLQREMEDIAAEMRDLIRSMPPHDLLGYLYSRYLFKAMAGGVEEGGDQEFDGPCDLINENQFLLEYVHAVLASDVEPADTKFDEALCTQLFQLARKLLARAMDFAIATSVDSKNGAFGPDTREIEYRAKANWVLLRGNRYQVLEGEFYRYVLTPHEDVLHEVYGVGAAEIAEGFQDMADAMRSGHVAAMAEMMKQFEAAQAFSQEQNRPLEDVVDELKDSGALNLKAASHAMEDMFRGGVSNVSRHTELPELLLSDLAYQRGEETEFFAAGDLSGTPYRTLPARKKPLIQLENGYYAIDPCSMRDAGYRTLLYNLLQRKPDYKELFKERQKAMSEAAFADILAFQLPDATVLNEVYYKDPKTKQWCENDTLILLDDVLFLVEAKAGAAATIASPALDFGRHAQSVKDLVIKAYQQCERFFNYLNSADEVTLYHLVDGEYKECGRVRRADYRLMIPIGLTVESFSPFSAFCKELPDIEPLLGKHAFISLSIDDLFVLKRFLSTPGQFVHYMEVRQTVAGTRRAHLFDEFDHLGAYLTKNRFDQDLVDQLKGNDLVLWDRMSEVIDKCFEGPDWEGEPLPSQTFPDELLRLLKAIGTTRSPGWLSAEGRIRDLGEEGRDEFAQSLHELRLTLPERSFRYFVLSKDNLPIFLWLQRHGTDVDWQTVNDKASAASLAFDLANPIGLLIDVSPDGQYHSAETFSVSVPAAQTAENKHVYEDARQMKERGRRVGNQRPTKRARPVKRKKIGRNELCPCGSGKKYKKCHGR